MRNQRLASGKSRVYSMPELNLRLSESPAEEDGRLLVALLDEFHRAREIDEADPEVLELDPEVDQLTTTILDVAGNGLGVAFDPLDLRRIARASAGGEEVDLEELLVPD